jgi:hypothetical protein
VLVLLIVAALIFISWPSSPEIRHQNISESLIEQLSQNGLINPIEPGKPPATYYVRVNSPFAETGMNEEGYFFADSPRPCLVEFLHDVPLENYRIIAEMRQITGVDKAELGLYVSHAGPQNTGSTDNRFVKLIFADIGLKTHIYPISGGQPGNALFLRGERLQPPDPPVGIWQTALLKRCSYPSVHVAKGEQTPWRTVQLEITPYSIHAKLDDYQLLNADPSKITPEIRTPLYPHGGVGVYLRSGRVAIRKFSVESLRNS